MSLARLAARRGGSLTGSLVNDGRLSRSPVPGARLSRSPVPGARLTRSIGSGDALLNDGGGIPDSSSSPYMKAAKRLLNKVKPSESTVLVIGLLGGTGTILSGVYMGYTWLEDRVAARAITHVNSVFAEEKQERQRFQHVATAAHHDFMSKSNESTAQIHREVAQLRLEMAGLRSEVLSLKQKEFKHRQELLIAADLLQRHLVEGPKLTEASGNDK